MKLFLSDLRASLRSVLVETSNIDNNIISSLRTNGYYVQEDFLSKEKSKYLAKLIEDIFANNSKTLQDNVTDGDQRLFNIGLKTDELNFFINNPLFETLMKITQGYSSKNNIGMANILKPIKNNLGSGGGWHRDSPFTNQFKAFLFLTDVTVENGPLQIVPKSHLAKNIRQVSTILRTPTSKYRFTDEEMAKTFTVSDLSPVKLTCKAGTMVVANVRVLHRGSPIVSGKRIALTNYYFKKGMPIHFDVK